MVVSMTIHPRYQYKPEELFQTDKTRRVRLCGFVGPVDP